MSLYLGVDGGGTKTAFVLIDDSGHEWGDAAGPSSYHLEHGLPHVEQVLVDGMAALTAKTGVRGDDVDYAFIAIPAYGEASGEVGILDELPARMLGHRRYACGNDMVAGWAGSLAHSDGINVVAGTGSMTYGERAGTWTRVGGWGELFGDEGSGYWIGRSALTAFTRMSDGRAPRTSLHERVRSAVDVSTDLDVIDAVLTRWERSRGRIASLAPLVMAAAAEGDTAARAILAGAVEHLVDLVDASRRNLGFTEHDLVPVSYSGGLFDSRPFRERFAGVLAMRSADYDLRAPLFSSVIGAALHAANLAGDPLEPRALSRLSDESSSRRAERSE